MGLMDFKNPFEILSKKKPEADKKTEEEKLNMKEEQEDRFKTDRVEAPETEGQVPMDEEDKDKSSSASSDDLLMDEDIVVCPDEDEIYVVKPEAASDSNDAVLSELETLKSGFGRMSAKLDAVIRAIDNMPKPHQSGSRTAETILSRITALTEQQKTLDSQQEIIKRQHDAMLKYNDDVIYKTQKGLILEMIGIADQVRMIMENKREDPSYDLMQGLQELEESIEASLSNNSVRRYSEADSDDSVLNRRRQTAVGSDTTSDPAKDGHFKSVAPGYEWTMPYLVVNSEVKLGKILEENQRPQTFAFVIRPEEVMKLRYKAPKQSPAPGSEVMPDEESPEKPMEGTIEF